MRLTLRHHPEVGTQISKVARYNTYLFQTAAHAHVQAKGGRILLDQSRTPTSLQRSHRGAATHSATAVLATATITIHMMSTHAVMIASATTAAM
jgi:hypothetical protein